MGGAVAGCGKAVGIGCVIPILVFVFIGTVATFGLEGPHVVFLVLAGAALAGVSVQVWRDRAVAARPRRIRRRNRDVIQREERGRGARPV